MSSVPYSLLVALYASMILFGATGNLLVILVVIRNSAMRTARYVGKSVVGLVMGEMVVPHCYNGYVIRKNGA